MTSPGNPAREVIEAVARAICLVDGAEEDGIQLVPGETYRDYARAAIEAHTAALSAAGMVIVPREPTDEMRLAAQDEYENVIVTNRHERMQCAIRAAIATPTPVPAASERMTERLHEFVAGARGPYTGLVSDLKSVLELVATLSARAEAAEARAERVRDLLKQAESRLVYWMTEASPADTLEAAQRVQTMIDTNPVIMAIRALRTAPPPTAKEG